mmetsp:Transcript_30373/g.67377  ORF Transcript_30373/g.67377 Transcript_30373/m.67377 type:complete len:104 (+) Transcript_30373:386-697(+)
MHCCCISSSSSLQTSLGHRSSAIYMSGVISAATAVLSSAVCNIGQATSCCYQLFVLAALIQGGCGGMYLAVAAASGTPLSILPVAAAAASSPLSLMGSTQRRV